MEFVAEPIDIGTRTPTVLPHPANVEEIVGIVTLDDLVVLLVGELVTLASGIDAESPPRATP